ncbi:MAG: serine hydrolase [Hyphomicrobiales bacterium]|nr:MAG: serine hydrolase [Hyphomicrobiales bacterium]
MKLFRNITRLVISASLATVMTAAAWADEWTHALPEEVGMSSARLQRLTNVMQGYIDSGDVAGMVILIARDGKLPYEMAFGKRDLATNAPMLKDTIFRIASQTKAIVSAGIMSLQEEGKLLVTEPLGKYLPEWMETNVAVAKEDGEGYDIVPAERSITIRDLLTHTSGIPYGAWINGLTDDAWMEAGFPGWYYASSDKPIRELVREMAALPMVGQPGEKWVYGLNLDILGALIEVVSGQTLDVFLKERFFDPLGMVDTQFYLPVSKLNRLATVYVRTGPGEITRASDEGIMWTQGDYVIGQGPNLTLSGGAGLLSTAHDYSVFLEMLRNDGATMSGEQLLSPMSISLLTTDHTGDIDFRPGVGFSYGFAVALDRGIIGTPGNVGEFRWGGAYHSTYWVDPVANLVVTAFTQFGATAGLDDQNKLRAMIYAAITD